MAAKDSLKLRPKEELKIALYDLDFSWYHWEIEQVIELWNEGVSIEDIALQVRPAKNGIKTRDDAVDEVALLIMHLRRQGMIRHRTGGAWGGDK
ncbi:hypothetical protein V6C27_02830 [Peptococcaceae bacterium 1198_IL3148]